MNFNSTSTPRAYDGDFYYKQHIPQGWECPKCGAVYAPSCAMCFHCGNRENKITTNSNSTQ